MTEPVLRVENLSKAFPGLQALDKVSIEVRAHEVVGLVGENGAGKSTLLKVLAGLYQPDSGVITLRARPVSHRNVAEAAEGGIGMVFQEQSLLPNVTVAENILLGHEGGGVRHGLYRWSHLYDQASAQLAKLGSSLLPNAQTDSLSFAERQVVELAKVLAIEERTRHEPVILLDEPTSILEA
jgi:ribose transport system ATP-binding protein